ncbi:MAG: dTMP kinase [Thermodesulfovibrio sp.]|nr:dTMP kinase [Thermodesulfovibrio sp.]
MRGAFISFEGIEGTGKSTQCRLLAEHLRQKGLSVTETAEPGGTHISLKIREILLSLDSRAMKPVTELLLYNAARVQHIGEVILPALQRGDVVITDRFSDSTIAYQGYGRDLDLELIAALDRIATNGLRPDLTILLDIEVETGLRRNRAAGKADRLELEKISFHEKVRKGFIALASGEPGRIKLIDCSGGIAEVQQKTAGIVTDFLKTYHI